MLAAQPKLQENVNGSSLLCLSMRFYGSVVANRAYPQESSMPATHPSSEVLALSLSGRGQGTHQLRFV